MNQHRDELRVYEAAETALKELNDALGHASPQAFCAAMRERYFPASDFVGAYEEACLANGVILEQWLYSRRHLINGRVLDMSGVRHWNQFIYELETVDEVVVSDLTRSVVEKLGHTTPATVIADFSAADLPMPAESLDTVLCLSVLEHCSDPFQMVANLGQILRPGGHLFVQCPYAYLDGHDTPDNWRFGRDGYLLLADKAGLEVVDIGSFGDYSPFATVLYGRFIGGRGGIPWMNWMICRRPG